MRSCCQVQDIVQLTCILESSGFWLCVVLWIICLFVTATVTYCKQMTAGCLEAWHVLDAVPRCALDSCCQVQHFVSYAEYVVLRSSCDFTYAYPTSFQQGEATMLHVLWLFGRRGLLELEVQIQRKTPPTLNKREAHIFFFGLAERFLVKTMNRMISSRLQSCPC